MSNSSTISFQPKPSTCADVTNDVSGWMQQQQSGEGPQVSSPPTEHFHDQKHSEQRELPNYDTGIESQQQSGDNNIRPASSAGKCSSVASEELEEQTNENNKQQTSWAARVGSKTGGGGYTQQPGAFPNIQSTVISVNQNLVRFLQIIFTYLLFNLLYDVNCSVVNYL